MLCGQPCRAIGFSESICIYLDFTIFNVSRCIAYNAYIYIYKVVYIYIECVQVVKIHVKCSFKFDNFMLRTTLKKVFLHFLDTNAISCKFVRKPVYHLYG